MLGARTSPSAPIVCSLRSVRTGTSALPAFALLRETRRWASSSTSRDTEKIEVRPTLLTLLLWLCFLHFGHGHQQSAHALRIVGYDFLAQIIFVAAVPVRIAAETANADGAFEINLAVRFGFDKLIQHPAVTFFRHAQVGNREITLVRTFAERVHEHGGGR